MFVTSPAGRRPCGAGTSGSPRRGTLDGIDRRSPNVDEAISWYRRGAVVTYTWHAVCPEDDEPVVFDGGIIRDLSRAHYSALLDLADGKPIGFGEVGELPPVDALDEQPLWSWFMAWPGVVTERNSETAIRALYASPRVVTLSE